MRHGDAVQHPPGEQQRQGQGADPQEAPRALHLARFFGVSPDLWLNLQTRRDLYRVQQAELDELEDIQSFKELKKLA